MKIFPEAVVPFTATRLANAKLVFSNDRFEENCDWLENYAYLIRSELETEADFLPISKVFYAERYGGPGISYNGGGARCGGDEYFDLKGIGKTPLAGTDSQFWHSHGGMALIHAIPEVIWGEVLHCALPFGAVRSAALVLTGTKCWLKDLSGKKVRASRALVVREKSIRPAHFERAVFFRPASGLNLLSETERMMKAVANLPLFLPMPEMIASDDLASMTREDRLHLGLVEMACRFAIQSAAAKAKRLMHGAISASNICLDGKWIDFGSVAVHPNYSNTKSFDLAPFVPTFWEDLRAYRLIFQNICFYVSKYCSVRNSSKTVSATQLMNIFLTQFDAAVKIYFVRSAGFSIQIIENPICSGEVDALGGILLGLARKGVEKPFTPNGDDLSRFTGCRLDVILLLLAKWHDDESVSSRVSRYVLDQSLLKNLVDSYLAVAIYAYACARASGIGKEPFRLLCVINTIKSGRNFVDLYRKNLMERSTSLSHSYELGINDRDELQNWVVSMRNRAEILYGDIEPYRTLLWKAEGLSVVYEAQRDKWVLEESGKRQYLDTADVIGHPQLHEMLEFWGDELSEYLSLR